MTSKEFDKWMRKTQHDRSIPIQKYHTQFQRFAKAVEAFEGQQTPANRQAVKHARQKLDKIAAHIPEDILVTYHDNANANKNILKAERLLAEYEAIINASSNQGLKEWGTKYTGLKGREAIDFLLKKGSGWVEDAFDIPGFGKVSIVYGKAGDPKNEYHGGYGLKHINDKHGPEFVAMIPEVLEKGLLVPSKKEKGKFEVWLGEHFVGINSVWDNEKINWIVTAYDEEQVEAHGNNKNNPRAIKRATTDSLTAESESSPNEDYKISLPHSTDNVTSQQGNSSNTHAKITGPTLQKRGEAWGSEQWSDKDYSVERDYATAAPVPATPVQNEADKKLALTRISDIMNKLRKIRPVRQGVDAPKSVLGYTDQQKQIARHRWAGDWKTAAHEIGHIVDYKLGLRDRVANSAQLAAMQQELEVLGVNTSPPNSTAEYLRKPSSAERYPIIHVRRMARA